MRARWLIVFLIWAVPLASMLACPYDLHGASTCSDAAQVGRTVSFYLASPGLMLGSTLSTIIQDDPYGGASGAAYAVGTICWLTLLSAAVYFLPVWLQRIFGRT